jgi:hypothetical protein
MNIVLLYLAGAVAVAIAVFAFWSSRVNRNLRGLDANLSKAKDAQLEVNLRNLDLEAARQQERAAKAERALLELQERLKWRTLTVEQATNLTNILKASPKREVIVRCVSGVTPEPCKFAEQLVRVFNESGWKVLEVRGILSEFTVTGLGVSGHDDDLSRLHANALAKAVGSIGFPVTVSLKPKGFATEPLIFTVGLKPIE